MMAERCRSSLLKPFFKLCFNLHFPHYSATLLLLLQGRASSHGGLFPVFFPSLFRTPWKLACKNWSFFAHRTILRYSFQGTQRPDHRSADLTVLKRYYSRMHLCLPYHSSTCFPCVDDTFEEKKAKPAQKIPWYVTTHTPSSFLSRFIRELKKPCRSGLTTPYSYTQTTTYTAFSGDETFP